MKKFVIISLILFGVFAILFGISVAATGIDTEKGFGLSFGPASGIDGLSFIGFENGISFVENGNAVSHSVNNGEYKYDFDGKNVTDISIGVTNADTVIKYGEGDSIKVTYKKNFSNGFQSFKAEVKDNKLIVKENIFTILFFGGNRNSLEIILPEKEYGNVDIANVSGNCSIDGVICKAFGSVLTSGNADYTIYGETIKLNNVSGSSEVTNCTDREAKTIKLVSISGSHTISGFMAEDIDIDTTSGDVTAEGISGTVKVNSVSGRVNLGYARWDGDLKIDMVSGDCDITLPEKSGVDIDFDRVSGDLRVNLDGNKTNFSGSTETTIGSENVHRIDADVVSGNIEISN